MREFRRKVVVLSGIAGALLLANVVGLMTSPSLAARSLPRLFPLLRYDSAVELYIERAGESLRMNREADGSWYLSGSGEALPVHGSKVRTLLDILAHLEPFREVTDDSAQHGRFGLEGNGSARIRVLDRSGKAIAGLTAGDLSPEGTGLYVRTAETDAVFLVSAEIASYLLRDENYWLRLGLLPEDVSSEGLIRIRVDGSEAGGFIIARVEEGGGATWTFADGSGAVPDPELTAEYVARITGAEASAPVRGTDGANRQLMPAGALEILTDRNRTYRIELFRTSAESDALYVAETGGSRYRIERDIAEGLLPPRESLLRSGTQE